MQTQEAIGWDAADEPTMEAPERIDRLGMVQRWDDLCFLHWPYQPETVAQLLPPGLRVDTMDGAAWIGIVPFRLTIRLPGTPTVPWAGRFAEVNVRTYVRGPDGRRGIWFLSLDAARLGGVLLARQTYRIPYVWAHTTATRRGSQVRYGSRRRWPGPRGASLSLQVRLGESVDPVDLDDLERFLMCRWRLYSPGRPTLPTRGVPLLATQVEHPPWPIRRAVVESLHESLIAATGLPSPTDSPLVHFSAGVAVRFGARRHVDRFPSSGVLA
jgi:uncharacterized protein YqjF (DUF2071 family)